MYAIKPLSASSSSDGLIANNCFEVFMAFSRVAARLSGGGGDRGEARYSAGEMSPTACSTPWSALSGSIRPAIFAGLHLSAGLPASAPSRP